MPISPNDEVAAAPLDNLLRVPRLHVDQVDVLRNLERGKDVCLLARESLVLQPLYWPRHKVLLSIDIKNLVEVASDLDRPNCYYSIFNYKSGLTALDFLFDDGPISTPEDVPGTLIYFEEIMVLQVFQTHLREILPTHLKAQGLQIVDSYYATRTTDTKTFVRVQFKVGKVCCIICTTEAFGMGMDISNITKVFQWGLPRPLASLIQRFGRAARDRTLTAYCTLVISLDDDFKCTNNVT